MLRTKLRALIRDATGFDVHKYEPGQSAINDIKRLIGRGKPVLFDIGANVGQTIDDLISAFPGSEIHAFEPGEKAFGKLSERYAHRATLNNCGVGSSEGRMTFFESAGTVMSSFLPIGEDGWGGNGAHRPVTVTTVEA
jgi:FkbM family methyltransferase